MGTGQFISIQATVHDLRRESWPVPHWLKGWEPCGSEVAVFSFRRGLGRCCHTSSPASYGLNPVFARSLLDFGEVRSLQYVQPIATAS
jgi:hypothetical protein